MALKFVGIDPNTGTGQSPAVWVDEESQEILIQGWKPSAALTAECAATVVPGHGVGIPESETVVRLRARMASILREACNAVEFA